MDDSILQISIMECVKKVIDINTDIDEYQLYKLLHETMISCHPDKFTNENIKNQASVKDMGRGLCTVIKLGFCPEEILKRI